MAYFTHYWSADRNDIDAVAGTSTPLDHSVDSRFVQRGVQVGDIVYILTAKLDFCTF